MPGELPNGWQAARFKDVMYLEERREPIDPKRVYKLLGVRWYGNGAFLREERKGDGLSAQHIYPVRSGDVIYNRLFAWKGSFGLVGDDLAGCHVSNEFPLFAARLDRIDPQFLLRVLQHPRTAERADAFSTGTTSISRNRLSEDDFLQFPLNLPPLAEQRAIVDVLSAVEAAIRKTEALIEALDAAKQGLINDLLFNAKDRINSREWKSVPLKFICALKGGYGFPEEHQGQTSGEIAFIKVSDMNVAGNEKYITRSNNYISHTLAKQLGVKPFAAGSTVFPKVGAALLTNKRRLLSDQTVVDNNMMVATPIDVQAEFLFLILSRIDMAEFVQVGAVPSVNQANVGAKIISLPPRLEREAIVHLAVTFDARIAAEKAALTELIATREALAQELLSGRLRLPESMIARHIDAPDKAA